MINFAALAALILTAAVGYFILNAPPEPLVESLEEAQKQALLERKQAIYENLRDLRFEHLAGKLTQADYQASRQLLENEAALALNEISRLEAGGARHAPKYAPKHGKRK